MNVFVRKSATKNAGLFVSGLIVQKNKIVENVIQKRKQSGPRKRKLKRALFDRDNKTLYDFLEPDSGSLGAVMPQSLPPYLSENDFRAQRLKTFHIIFLI